MPIARRRTLVIFVAIVVAVVLAIAANGLFWFRYLNAYTFESFVENPFPTDDRLYPQERVVGAQQPREFPRANDSDRAINNAALEAAATLAEEADSTSLLVLHDGVLQLERYWLGAAADRPVYSFSMHKSVVALLIGIALAEGKISNIDEPLASDPTGWNVADERSEITIRHALQMNSGLEPMTFPKNPFSKHVRRQIGTDVAGAALSYQLSNRPGETFEYNGANPTLLVRLLERETGLRYSQYLSEKLWRPLGNRDAALWLDRPGGLARGATSLFAVPMDWLRIGEMFRNGGKVDGRQVISPEWLRMMITPSPTNPRYGFLTWLGQESTEERVLDAFEGFSASMSQPFQADDLVFFDGLGGQRVYVVPSYKLVIVRTGVLNSTWEDAVLPNILIEDLQHE